MWTNSENGFEAKFPAKNGEMLTVELDRKKEQAIVKGNPDRILMAMRDNKVKIYNDLFFEGNINNSIKERMGQLFIKKVVVKNNKRR